MNRLIDVLIIYFTSNTELLDAIRLFMWYGSCSIVGMYARNKFSSATYVRPDQLGAGLLMVSFLYVVISLPIKDMPFLIAILRVCAMMTAFNITSTMQRWQTRTHSKKYDIFKDGPETLFEILTGKRFNNKKDDKKDNDEGSSE